MADLLHNPRLCGGCDSGGCELKCACKLVYYCGRECQKKDWPRHKKNCAAALDKKVKDVKREHGKDDVRLASARFDAAKSHFQQGRYAEAER
jgi:hypothetical protein